MDLVKQPEDWQVRDRSVDRQRRTRGRREYPRQRERSCSRRPRCNRWEAPYLEGIEIDILAANRVVVSWNEITQDAGTRNLGNVYAQLFRVGSFAPRLAVGANVTYVENSPPQILASAATVSDADSPNSGGGKLTVAIASNGTALDRLKIQPSGKGPGQINLSGNQVLIGSIVIGTHSGEAGTTPLVVNLRRRACRRCCDELRSIPQATTPRPTRARYHSG